MADINRKTVDTLVLHHSVTPMWEGYSKAWLAQWFSDNGFARAYGSNPGNWSGLINPYTGARSYAQAQLAGQRVVAETPDATDAEREAGYRLVPLVQDIWGQICWHAGNWEINRASIGIENLGDYRNYTLRENDCKVIADFWRPQDRKLAGKTAIFGHKEVTDSATACPARIMEQRNHIVDLINASDSGWPKPPVNTTKEEVKTEVIPFETKTVEDTKLDKGQFILTTQGVNGLRTIVYTVTYTDGKETKRVVKSDSTVKPITEIITVGKYVEPPVIEPEQPEPVEPELPIKPINISWLINLIKWLINLIRRTK